MFVSQALNVVYGTKSGIYKCEMSQPPGKEDESWALQLISPLDFVFMTGLVKGGRWAMEVRGSDETEERLMASG